MAAQLGEEWIDVLLDDEEPLPADLLLTIRAALQGPARGAAAGATKDFQDAVGITIPRREDRGHQLVPGAGVREHLRAIARIRGRQSPLVVYTESCRCDAQGGDHQRRGDQGTHEEARRRQQR